MDTSSNNMSSEIAAVCSYTWSWDVLKLPRSVSLWKAIEFQLLFWNEMHLLPLFCLALTFSTPCATFSAGFALGSTFTFVSCSWFVTESMRRAVSVARKWWHEFRESPADWRRIFSNGWSAVKDNNVDDGVPAVSPYRFCFSVGISRYADADFKPLENGVRNAAEVAKAFKAIGYNSYLVENASNMDALDRKMDEFVNAQVAQHGAEEGQTTTVVVYFAGHGVENAAGQLNVCLSDVGHSNNASYGFMSARTLTDNLIAKISKKAGSSKGLACLAFWDCCRRRTPELPHKPAEFVRNKFQHQHAEIRSCKSGQAARDGVFASALCRYVERNDCYQVKELYELVNADVEKATYRFQTCSFICESTELSLRADLFVTPAKWAECCFKLEELKPDEVSEAPSEAAFFTENLELREQTQRLQGEKNQMQQMQTFLAKEDDRFRSVSIVGKWRQIVFVPMQLGCLCFTFRLLLLPLAVELALQQCQKDLRRMQSSQALLSIWLGLFVCGTTTATACSWSLRMKKTALAARNQVLSQDISQLAARHQVLNQDISQLAARNQVLSQDISQLAARNQVLRQDISQLHARNQVLRQDISQLHARNQVLRQDISQLAARNQVLSQDISELAARNQVLSQDISQLRENRREMCQAFLENLGHANRANRASLRALRAEMEEHRKRRVVEQELEVVQDARRRAAHHRRANVVRHKAVFERISIDCRLCGKRGIGKENHWRSKENSSSSFCRACIDDESE